VYGFDGCKKVKGRKGQTLVDSLGLVLKLVVSEANAPEGILTCCLCTNGTARGTHRIIGKSPSFMS
jgi:transposase